MTLARTALRLAVVQAIAGVKGDRPTIAEGRVYDSRASAEQPEAFAEDAKAIVLVLTDGDEGDALSDQNGGPPFRRNIELVLDIGMVCQEKADDEPSGYVLVYPDTDARLEASLDVLETQIIRQLAAGGDPLAIWFQNHVRVWKRESHRQVEDETGVKLARRVTTLACELSDDKYEVDATGLPEPLHSVAVLMPPGSYGAETCATIAANLGPTPFDAVDFDGVNMQISVGQADEMVDVSVEIKNALDVPQVVASGAPVVIDYAKGPYQNLILAADVTDLRFVGWPPAGKTGRLILQVTNTGNFAISGWPSAPELMWAGGAVGEVTPGAEKRDIFVFTTVSGGAEIFGNTVGQDYS